MVQARKDIYATISTNGLSQIEGQELLRHILVELGHRVQEIQLRENWERIKEISEAGDNNAEAETNEEDEELSKDGTAEGAA